MSGVSVDPGVTEVAGVSMLPGVTYGAGVSDSAAISPQGFRLLESGTSDFRLLEDGVSLRLLEG